MSQEIEAQIEKIPILRALARKAKKVKFRSIGGLALYDILELYGIGIAKGAFSFRAAAIAFSFFMALFPFALFILNLIPYIPIKGFREDFLQFVADSVPPNTFDAISVIIEDIMKKSYKSLLSSGILLSIILMANGVNAILGGFQNSYHAIEKRNFFRQYAVALGMGVVLSLILIFTVAAIVIFEVLIQKLQADYALLDKVYLVVWGRYIFVMLMILVTTSIVFKFGSKEYSRNAFISIGSIFTTILIIISSYFFGIYVVRFSRYNELYGSIGTLLVLMIYIWLNCVILLLGFELNATIHKLKRKSLYI